jgi:hypothetical protein
MESKGRTQEHAFVFYEQYYYWKEGIPNIPAYPSLHFDVQPA